jgi:hypothetical protein
MGKETSFRSLQTKLDALPAQFASDPNANQR